MLEQDQQEYICKVLAAKGYRATLIGSAPSAIARGDTLTFAVQQDSRRRLVAGEVACQVVDAGSGQLGVSAGNQARVFTGTVTKGFGSRFLLTGELFGVVFPQDQFARIYQVQMRRASLDRVADSDWSTTVLYYQLIR